MNALNFVTQPLFYLLTYFSNLTGNLGFSIIILTLLVRLVLVPLSIPSLKMAKAMQDLKPKIDKLKAKYKGDNTKLQQATLDLYKEHGVNPASGCLPQIAQLIIIIALYQVFVKFIGTTSINTHFFYLDLKNPDPIYVLPVLAGITQLIFSLMLQPGIKSDVKNPKKKAEKQKEEDALEMASSVQQQMVFLMPFMTFVISLNFPSGLGLYWVITTIFSIVQQYVFSGPGGLIYYTGQIKSYTNIWMNKK